MAAGEYVSVSSQADTERADLARERKELADAPEEEHAELAAIYVKRQQRGRQHLRPKCPESQPPPLQRPRQDSP